MPAKQVIVIRKDLKMRRGKEIAQGSHASMAWLSERVQQAMTGDVALYLTPEERQWIDGRFTKVCLQVDSEQELLQVHKDALAVGLTSKLITDAGATEFHGVPTNTCLAIGPDEAEKIDVVTRNLRLY